MSEPYEDIRTSNDGDIKRALEVASSKMDTPVSVAAIAGEIGISPCCLRRIFHSRLGRSPLQTFRAIKLQAAAELLRDTKLTIKEIAGATGYRSISHFIAEFRRLYGSGPSTYRKNSNN